MLYVVAFVALALIAGLAIVCLASSASEDAAYRQRWWGPPR